MNRPAPLPGVWDTGLQPERAGLAWRRAAVSFLVLGLATPKVAWTLLDAWSLVPAGALLCGSVVLIVLSRRRYEQVNHALATARPHHLPDGRLPAVAAGLALFCSLMAGAVVAGIAGHLH